jgi:hypothetical protein
LSGHEEELPEEGMSFKQLSYILSCPSGRLKGVVKMIVLMTMTSSRTTIGQQLATLGCPSVIRFVSLQKKGLLT